MNTRAEIQQVLFIFIFLFLTSNQFHFYIPVLDLKPVSFAQAFVDYQNTKCAQMLVAFSLFSVLIGSVVGPGPKTLLFSQRSACCRSLSLSERLCHNVCFQEQGRFARFATTGQSFREEQPPLPAAAGDL
jgi:hypothetical protein